MSSITLSKITKNYGKVQVIREFDAVFNDKEFITLLGPSGCGKTTLLRMIAGFEKPSSGEIKIDDTVVTGENNFITPDKRNIGMVFQSYAVWPHMNVFNNVAYPLKIQGMSREDIKVKVEKILEAVHLENYAERMPNELSGGQQQRVALGRALVANPKVLLLDEPLSNLDAKLREAMRFEIKEVQRNLGITVVYVTHDQTEAMAMSDRIFILNNGVIQQEGAPTDIYKRPVNKFAADFIGRINFIDGEAVDGKIVFSDGQYINYSGDKRGAVVVAVRPEDIQIIVLNAARADLVGDVQAENKNILQGVLTGAYYLGDVTDCRVKSCGAEIRVTAAGDFYSNKMINAPVCLGFWEYLVF